MKTVNIFFSVGLEKTWSKVRDSIALRFSLIKKFGPSPAFYIPGSLWFRISEVILPGDVAVHHIRTWIFIAFDQWREESGLVDVEEQEDKHWIHCDLENQAAEVGPPETPAFLARVIVQGADVFPVLQPVFALAVIPVGHMESHQKGRAGDEDQLESPEASVADGEVPVIADVAATGLAGVAVKVLLLVTPNLLASHEENHEPEDENDSEPDATESCWVLVHPAEEALEEGPVHGVVSFRYRAGPPTKKKKSTKTLGWVLEHRILGLPELSKGF